MNVGIDGRMEENGRVGEKKNRGVIEMDKEGFGQMKVKGNYKGKDGRIEIEKVIGEDKQIKNRIVIEGDKEGKKKVSVKNSGGIGDKKVEGIKIIKVGGE